jgi:hypothetical protein
LTKLPGGFAELVDHHGAEHGGLEQRAQGGSHAAEDEQALVVVLVEPSGVQHFGQIGRQPAADVTLSR